MSIEHHNPETLFIPGAFTQVVTATGHKHIFIAGQLPLNTDAVLIGKDDPAAQAEQVLQNLTLALESVGAGLENVTCLRVYLKSPIAEVNKAFRAARAQHFEGLPLPAASVVGVVELALPDALIEVEAQAVLD